MCDYYCPTCKDKWPGTYTCEHRCTVCGDVIKAVEPWREGEGEQSEEGIES